MEELAVVREEEQPGGLHVEAADRLNPLGEVGPGQRVEDRGAAVVDPRGHHADRLVMGEHDRPGSGGDDGAADLKFGVEAVAELPDAALFGGEAEGLSVDGQLAATAARPGLCEPFARATVKSG